jgi:hypothetical protein
MGFLRLRGIRLFPYLDDILIVAESRNMLLSHLKETIHVLLQGEFVVNTKKSCLDPQQELTFLGAVIRTHKSEISIPLEKAHRIRDMALSFKMSQSYTARMWLQLIGLMASTIQMIRYARLRMRVVQLHVNARWNRTRHPLSFQISVTQEVFAHIQWWTNLDNLLSAMPLFAAPEQFVVTTDAS